MTRRREFGAVPIPCPNGCGNPVVSHTSPDLIAELLRIAVPDDLFYCTGYCKRCEVIVRVTWKDVPHTDLDRAA